MNPYPDDFNGDAFDRSQGTDDQEANAAQEEAERLQDERTACTHWFILEIACQELAKLEYIAECPVPGYDIRHIINELKWLQPQDQQWRRRK